MQRRGWVCIVAGVGILVAAISLLSKPRNEVGFLYDLGPSSVKISDSSVSPIRRNETTSFDFTSEKRAAVIRALGDFAGRRGLRLETGSDGYGSITGDPGSIYIVDWRFKSAASPFSWEAPGGPHDLIVNVFRKESPLEVRLHDLKRLLHIEK
jgi:hypothetical protein